MVIKTGIAVLPLHYGRAPRWFFGRMVKLSKSISTVIVDEYGQKEFLSRISDPFWFQAFGNVLGFDWHSSGLSTTVCGALKISLEKADLGIHVAGGKGKTSMKTPEDIQNIGDEFSLSEKKINDLIYSSKMAAKVDNSVLQDGYQLYHHSFFVSEKGDWSVVQQGLNDISSTARRYHWLSFHTKSFVNEPREGIITDLRHKKVIDMSARESEEARKTSVDLVKEGPEKVNKYFNELKIDYKNSLLRFFEMPKGLNRIEIKVEKEILRMPRKFNWNIMQNAFEFNPKNYEELVALKGIGPSSIRALALISHLIFGSKMSWKDPAKYSFAHGGKDAIPYKLNKKRYDKSIEILEAGISEAMIGDKEKILAIKRLKDFLEL